MRRSSTQPRLSFWRLTRTGRSARPSPRAIRPVPLRRTSAAVMALRRPARRSAAIALWNTVHRPRLLHLLTRADRIAFLQKLGERRSCAFGDRFPQVFWQVGECHIWVDRLHIAKKLVRQSTGPALQRRNPIEDCGEDDRLHDVTGGSRHSGLVGGLSCGRSLSHAPDAAPLPQDARSRQ